MKGALRPFSRRAIRRTAYGVIALVGLAARIRGRVAPPGGSIPDSILVVRVDLLGDVLFTLPLVEGLRRAYPSAHISLLTLPYTAPLATLCPAASEVITVDTNAIRTVRGLLSPSTWRAYRSAYRTVRGRKYDLAISVYGQMGSLLAFLSGAPRRTGYAKEAYPFLLTDALPGGRHKERIHEVEYVRRLACHAGAVDVPDRLSIQPPPSAVASIQVMLQEEGVGERDRLVLIHAGAVNGAAKRWPVASWAAFADALHAETGARVVLIGSASDAAIAEKVRAGAESRLVSLAGRTGIEDLIALIARADLVASGDSGPLHLAVALGKPVVAVYGPTDPQIYGPYHPIAPARVHRKDLPCSPCYTLAATAECPLGDPICMRLVRVDTVVASAVRLLGR